MWRVGGGGGVTPVGLNSALVLSDEENQPPNINVSTANKILIFTKKNNNNNNNNNNKFVIKPRFYSRLRQFLMKIIPVIN